MAMPALRRMLVVLGNVTVVVMVALSGERCRRQRKSDGKNHQQTKIAKLKVLPPGWPPKDLYRFQSMSDRIKRLVGDRLQIPLEQSFGPLLGAGADQRLQVLRACTLDGGEETLLDTADQGRPFEDEPGIELEQRGAGLDLGNGRFA